MSEEKENWEETPVVKKPEDEQPKVENPPAPADGVIDIKAEAPSGEGTPEKVTVTRIEKPEDLADGSQPPATTPGTGFVSDIPGTGLQAMPKGFGRGRQDLPKYGTIPLGQPESKAPKQLTGKKILAIGTSKGKPDEIEDLERETGGWRDPKKEANIVYRPALVALILNVVHWLGERWQKLSLPELKNFGPTPDFLAISADPAKIGDEVEAARKIAEGEVANFRKTKSFKAYQKEVSTIVAAETKKYMESCRDPQKVAAFGAAYEDALLSGDVEKFKKLSQDFKWKKNDEGMTEAEKEGTAKGFREALGEKITKEQRAIINDNTIAPELKSYLLQTLQTQNKNYLQNHNNRIDKYLAQNPGDTVAYKNMQNALHHYQTTKGKGMRAYLDNGKADQQTLKALMERIYRDEQPLREKLKDVPGGKDKSAFKELTEMNSKLMDAIMRISRMLFPFGGNKGPAPGV